MQPAASGSSSPSEYTIENTTDPGKTMNRIVARRAASRFHQPSARRWTMIVATSPPAAEMRAPATVAHQIPS